jgi:hypothetical protein
VPGSLAAVAVLEAEHSGEFGVIDLDGRLGAVHDGADQRALLTLAEERESAGGGGGVGLGSHCIVLAGVGEGGTGGCRYEMWVWVCGCECMKGYADMVGRKCVRDTM